MPTIIEQDMLHLKFNFASVWSYYDLDAEYYDEIIGRNDEELAIYPTIKNLVIFEDILQRKWLTRYFATYIKTNMLSYCNFFPIDVQQIYTDVQMHLLDSKVLIWIILEISVQH